MVPVEMSHDPSYQYCSRYHCLILRLTFIYLFCMMCVHVCVHTLMCVTCVSWHMFSCRNAFSPSIMWAPGIEFRSLGLVASVSTHGVT